MFEEWTGDAGEIQLGAGDLLVLYSDGVTEAADRGGEEFGIERVAAVLRRDDVVSSRGLLDDVLHEVERFGAAQQSDDITLVVARCR